MTSKGQEEDNRQQLSEITEGAIFSVICHCLLGGGLAFLVSGWCASTVWTSQDGICCCPGESGLGPARTVWLWQGVSISVEKVKPEKH